MTSSPAPGLRTPRSRNALRVLLGKPFGSSRTISPWSPRGTAAIARSKVLLDELERSWVGDAGAPETTSHGRAATRRPRPLQRTCAGTGAATTPARPVGFPVDCMQGQG